MKPLQMLHFALLVVCLVFPIKARISSVDDYLRQNEKTILNRETSPECEKFRDAYINGVMNGDDWALEMLDSTGKIPSAIMRGNNYEFGFYDECLDINVSLEDDSEIRGKYCFAGLIIPYQALLENGSDLSPPSRIKQDVRRHIQRNVRQSISKNAVARAEFDMNFEGILLISVCVPDKCAPSDIFGELGVDAMCETKNQNKDLDGSDIACLVFFAVILALMVCSTLYDVYLHYQDKRSFHPVLLAFSLYTNGEKILKTSKANDPNQIQCFHGIKVLSMAWVIAGHSMAVKQIPMFVLDPNDAEPWERKWYSLYILQAPLAVDSFLFLSGALLSYNFLKTMRKPNAKFNIFLYYLHRYIRLTPALAVVYFITVTIMRRMFDGPLYSLMVDSQRETCLNSAWPLFLYLQNYVRKEADMCLIHTWYLSLDMQVFVISPLILLPLLKFRKQMIMFGLPILIFASILTPFLILVINDVEFWSDDYYNLYYYVTHTRLAPWLIGIICGVLLLKTRDRKIPISNLWNFCIWILNLVVMGVVIFTQNDVIFNHGRWKTSFYLALYKAVWSVCLGWIVFACVNGGGGIINRFLSCSFFQVLGKLTYSIYLVHVTTVFAILSSRRYKTVVQDLDNIYEIVANTCFSIVVGAFWCLAFESPIIIIEKMIFGGGARKPKKVENETPEQNIEVVTNGSYKS